MWNRDPLALWPACFVLAFAQAHAQDPAPGGAGADTESDVIVVEGVRARGTTVTDIAPEVELNESDIAAYGASTLGELLTALLTETASSRGRSSGPPIVLINGRRVSGFRELENYPAEAIARVQVLPEEAALAYGFAADQRIVNFILKPSITVRAAEIEGEWPADGGTSTGEASFQRLKVDGDKRFSIDGAFTGRSPLLEAERDIVSTSSADAGAFRTLVAEEQTYRLGFTAARDAIAKSLLTVSGSVDHSKTDSLLGLAPGSTDLPLARENTSDTARLGLALASDLGPRTWTITASLVQSDSDSLTDLPDGTGVRVRQTRIEETQGEASLLFNARLDGWGPGPIGVTGQLAAESLSRDNVVIDALTPSATEAERDTLRASASIDVPLREASFGGNLLSVNANAKVEDLSDVGTLVAIGVGATFRPSEPFRLIFSATAEEGAPSLSALTAPILVTPESRVFDFTTGTDVLATVTTGGNPDLGTDSRTVFKVGGQLRLSETPDLRLNVDYTQSRIEGEVRTFSLLTESFEAAFPDRVVRDIDGTLLAFDRRPVGVERTERAELRTTINWTKPLGPQGSGRPGGGPLGAGGAPSGPPATGQAPGQPQTGQPPTAQGQTAQSQTAQGQPPQGTAGAPSRGQPPAAGQAPAAAGQGGPPGRGGFGGGRPGQLRLTLSHRWQLSDTLTIGDGTAALDFLDGDALGASGGTAEHLIDASLNRWNRGLGMSISAQYQSATEVTQRDGVLDFSERLLANARLTYEFNASPKTLARLPLLKETRLAVGVQNIFDQHIDVTDETGATPLAFQDDLQDPLGRVISLELRKRF